MPPTLFNASSSPLRCAWSYSVQDRLVQLLGAISLGMGACLLAPARASHLFGLGDRPLLVTAIAARDLIIGLGLVGLLPGSTRRWLYVHAAADTLDGTFVARSLYRGTIARARGLAWLALTGGGALAALTSAARGR